MSWLSRMSKISECYVCHISKILSENAYCIYLFNGIFIVILNFFWFAAYTDCRKPTKSNIGWLSLRIFWIRGDQEHSSWSWWTNGWHDKSWLQNATPTPPTRNPQRKRYIYFCVIPFKLLIGTFTISIPLSWKFWEGSYLRGRALNFQPID